jgi:Domain of unknown function (DUF4157)
MPRVLASLARRNAVRQSSCTPAPAPAAPPPIRSNQATLRRLEAGRRAAATAHDVSPVVNRVLQDPGQPLDPATRGFFERGFGRDLSHVRVHTDTLADRSARSVDATAYAVGPHLVFRAGRYAPAGAEGFRLLAHELAHVAQSDVATDEPLRVGRPDAPEEHQADKAADRLSAGLTAGLPGPAAEPALRRDGPDDDKKPTPKPLIPLPVVDQFDPLPYVPFPNSSGPTPYDAPNKVPSISGQGPSLEDLHKGGISLFGKTPLRLGLKPTNMPDCSKLESPSSTSKKRQYYDFKQYELMRRLYHDRMSQDPWPILTPGEYDNFIQSCPRVEPDLPQPDIPPKPPLQDAPMPNLPKGQAYA